MLVLTRRNGERVTLQVGPGGLPEGAEISVTVCRLKADRARLGFNGPRSVKILRQELVERNLNPAA